jgi:hypothetical protein
MFALFKGAHYPPRGWFQWYCRYYMGRRMPDEDGRQIKRWKAIRRHVRQLQLACEPGDLSCRRRQRQALLHWAYDSRKRKALGRAIAGLGAGDVLLVTRLDRLARSTRDLLNTLDAVGKAGAGFRSLADAWADTTTPHGRLMLTVLGGPAPSPSRLDVPPISFFRGTGYFALQPQLLIYIKVSSITVPFRFPKWKQIVEGGEQCDSQQR